MKRTTFRIAGQAPKVRWKRNVGRRKKSIVEAKEIAKRNGVAIPDDVDFVEAEPGHLKGCLKELFAGGRMETARGPEVGWRPEGYVLWKDHYNLFGKIMFQVHPEILTGDECIVAVFQHEMFELAEFREVFQASRAQQMNTTDYRLQAMAGLVGNFHDQAWDSADEIVLRMREEKRK